MIVQRGCGSSELYGQTSESTELVETVEMTPSNLPISKMKKLRFRENEGFTLGLANTELQLISFLIHCSLSSLCFFLNLSA